MRRRQRQLDGHPGGRELAGDRYRHAELHPHGQPGQAALPPGGGQRPGRNRVGGACLQPARLTRRPAPCGLSQAVVSADAKPLKNTLTNAQKSDRLPMLHGSKVSIWVWRSLVACLNGVQEAGSSSLLTQTEQKPLKHKRFEGFLLCAEGEKKPPAELVE